MNSTSTPGALPRALGARALIVASATGVWVALSGASEFYASQASQAMTLALLAVSLDVVWGHARILSLGQTLPFGVAAYLAAKLSIAAPTQTVPAVASAVVAGAAVGALMGSVLVRRHRSIVTIALFTLLVTLLAEQLANKSQFIGGFNGLSGVGAFHLGPLALSSFQRNLLIVAVCVSVVIVVADFFRLPVGGVIMGVGDSEPRMAASGYNTVAVKIMAFAVSGAVAGLGGALYALQTGFVFPGVFGFGFVADSLLWTLLGGLGSLTGPVAATVALTTLEEYLAASILDYWVLSTGVAFIALVMFVPGGLMPALRRLARLPSRTPNTVDLRSGAETSPEPISLRAEGLGCVFGRFEALRGVDLSISQARVHCLIGPNGAGKTTLLDSLCGFSFVSAGTVKVDGTDLTNSRPWTFARAGVARKFQTPQVLSCMTVAENLALTSLGRLGMSRRLWSRHWVVELAPAVHRALAGGGLDSRLDCLAGSLSHGELQWLETALALSIEPRLLLLDEPTAGLTAAESRHAADDFKDLAHRVGLPLLIVEHDTAFIRGAAECVTVLGAGSVVAQGSVADVELDDRVKELYLAT